MSAPSDSERIKAEIDALVAEAHGWEWPPTFATFRDWLERLSQAGGS